MWELALIEMLVRNNTSEAMKMTINITTCLGSNWNCSNWLCFVAETFKLSLQFTTINKGNQTHYPITGTLHTFLLRVGEDTYSPVTLT